MHFGVMKEDTVIADVIRRTTFGSEENPKLLESPLAAMVRVLYAQRFFFCKVSLFRRFCPVRKTEGPGHFGT